MTVDIMRYNKKRNELPVERRKCLGCKHNREICECYIYNGNQIFGNKFER